MGNRTTVAVRSFRQDRESFRVDGPRFIVLRGIAGEVPSPEADRERRTRTIYQSWLSDMDSNHDKGLQRALCYHYTIGQTAFKLSVTRGQCKQFFR